MIDSLIPSSVAQVIRSRWNITNATRVKPGLSGAKVFRCLSGDGQEFALKCWPKSTSPSRVTEIHHVVKHSLSAGCHAMPQVYLLGGKETVLRSEGTWDLMDWLAGESLSPDATPQFAEAGAAAIASFHRATASLGTSTQVAPAVMSRLKRLRELDDVMPEALRGEASSRLPGQTATPRLIDALCLAQSILRPNWRSVAARISHLMNQHVERPTSTQLVLRDVHRDHVLFAHPPTKGGPSTRDGISTGGRPSVDKRPSFTPHPEVSGLVDFDAIRVDSPAADMARWAGSFLVSRQDPEPLWQSVLAGFQRQTPSRSQSDGEALLELAKDLHFATKWISLANWVAWLVVEHRRFPGGEDTVSARILEWAQMCEQES